MLQICTTALAHHQRMGKKRAFNLWESYSNSQPIVRGVKYLIIGQGNCLLLPQPPLYSAGPSALSLTEHFMHLAVFIVSSFKYLLQKVLFLKATNNLDFFQTRRKNSKKYKYTTIPMYSIHCLVYYFFSFLKSLWSVVFILMQLLSDYWYISTVNTSYN